MILLVDNGSVFTKNIIEFLCSTKSDHIVIPFDKVNLGDLEKFDSFILSGRRHNDSNHECAKLENHSSHHIAQETASWDLLWRRNFSTKHWWDNSKNEITPKGPKYSTGDAKKSTL